MHMIGFAEGEERVKRAENLCKEIMVEKFLNLKKETDSSFKIVPVKINKSNRLTLRHIVIKLLKVKEKTLKNSKRKTTYNLKEVNSYIYQQIFQQKLGKPEGFALL